MTVFELTENEASADAVDYCWRLGYVDRLPSDYPWLRFRVTQDGRAFLRRKMVA